VLAQLMEHRLLDDGAFAEYWIEQRQTFRPRGARLLQAELCRHGIAAGLAQEAASLTAESADADAYRAAFKRAHQLRGLPAEAFKTRLSSFLARRGFEWETIASVVARLAAETLSSS
jgi:regulatory protein